MLNLDDDYAMLSGRFAEKLACSQGKPFAFDHGGMRTLHFDGRYIQSAMYIAAPDELLLSYTRAMMAFLLTKPTPRHILMIGLGGGSLAKFCYRHLSATRITVLELDHHVIALRRQFMLPEDSERFQIIHADADDYLFGMQHTVDVILHDGFVADGLAPKLSTEIFYRRCSEVLDGDGVLVSNVFGTTDDLMPVMKRLRKVFGPRMWWGDPSGCINRIILAMKDMGHMAHRPTLVKRAEQLDLRHGLGLGDFVDRLKTAHDKNGAEFDAIADYDAGATFMPY
ncbi:transferase spermidine synthase [Duganella rhizosphaerae]|uniref:spermine/spermidine synthase domain-containing protein n=1 Tax=Duganella rhizosphaerae TaxID=2885763 RepID=UPI00403F478D